MYKNANALDQRCQSGMRFALQSGTAGGHLICHCLVVETADTPYPVPQITPDFSRSYIGSLKWIASIPLDVLEPCQRCPALKASLSRQPTLSDERPSKATFLGAVYLISFNGSVGERGQESLILQRACNLHVHEPTLGSSESRTLP